MSEIKLKPRTEICENDIILGLMLMRVIDKEFTGSVTIHFNQGGITDYERLEKGLKKKIKM